MLRYSIQELRERDAILGSIIHSISFGELQVIDNGMIIFSNRGLVEQVVDLDSVPVDRRTLSEFRSLIDHSGKLIIPGFVDAHCHAPQYVFSGTGMDLPLLAWLEKYTFPCEARFADTAFARDAYAKSIRRHLKCGTTFAAYFATIHNSGGKVLVDVIREVGQRAFVGKVSMDRNSPDFYIEETVRGCEDAEEFARYVLSQTSVGAVFVASVDAQVPVTGDELLAHATYNDIPALGGDESQGDSASFRAFHGVTPSSSGVKRPRSVSMGEEDGISRLSPRPARTSAVEESPLLHAVSGNSYGSSSSNVGSSRVNNGTRSRALSEYSADNAAAVASPPVPPTSTLPARTPRISFAPDTPGGENAAVFALNRPATVTTLLNSSFTPLVMPCVTPRFVPTCSSAMLSALGRIAHKYGLPVQSHLSESVNEIAWVKDLHPESEGYAAVYLDHGLLHEHCVMAHCCHSDHAERQLLAACSAAVVHCPSSNFTLESGVLDVHSFLEDGVKVGLGTDVAGGYSPSMLDAIRQSIIASKVVLFESRGDLVPKLPPPATEVVVDNTTTASPAVGAAAEGNNTAVETSSAGGVSQEAGGSTVTTSESADNSDAAAKSAHYTAPKKRTLSYKEAFHLATVGGAEALNMGNVVGNFVPGKKLDCLVVDPFVANGPFDCFDGEGPLEWFQKFLFLGDDRNIVAVFVDGRQVI